MNQKIVNQKSVHQKITKVELITLLAIAAVLVSQLFIAPVIGLADNGDFSRVMSWGGVQYTTDDPAARYFNFFNQTYALGPAHLGRYVSSEVVLMEIAEWVNKLFYSKLFFDIRFLGAVHSLLLLGAVWLLMSGLRKQRMRRQWLIGGLLFFSLADVGFFAYFNSFFSEPASLLCLLLLIGCVLHLTASTQSQKPNANYWFLLGAVLSAILFVTAKVQNAVLGFLLALFFIRLLRLHAERRWKRVVITASALLLAVTVAASSFNAFDRINIYQAVFYGVLKDSPTPQADLRELGIRQDYAVLANTNYFTPDKKVDINSQAFDRDFYDHINRGKILEFYALHPGRFLQKMEATASSSLHMQFYLGNYAQQAHRGAGAQSHAFSQWTYFLDKAVPKQLWFFLFFFVANGSVLVYEWRKAATPHRKRLYEFMMTVLLMGIAQFALPIFGDGEADLSKHLFLFDVLFGVMLLGSVLWTIRVAMGVEWKGAQEEQEEMLEENNRPHA